MTGKQVIVLMLIVVSVALGKGCIDYRQANDAAVKKLRIRLLNEDFDDMYKNTSNVTQAQLSRDEFVSRLQDVTGELKSIDPELNWRRVDHTPDNAVFKDDNFSWVYLEKDGHKFNVQMEWAPGFQLCGMSTFTELEGSGKRIFRNCD
jgi:hypothetical protein